MDRLTETEKGADTMPKFTVYFVNHFRFSTSTFTALEDAIGYVKRTGFDARIDRNGKPVAGWDIIGGLREL